MCLCIWMCAVCIVHAQDTYTNVYHAHAHACIHARIHTYLGRLGSALSSERPPVLVLLHCFSSHPVPNRHLCVCERECVCVIVCVCMCVGSATVIITANFCAQVACATGFMSARTDFKLVPWRTLCNKIRNNTLSWPTRSRRISFPGDVIRSSDTNVSELGST